MHSINVFMSNIIDYAGLFPPAKLPMAKAASNYLAYRHSDEMWMLARFVCPLGRLEELHQALAGTKAVGKISALGGEQSDFANTLPQQIHKINNWNNEHSNVSIDSWEAPIPTKSVITRQLCQKFFNTWAGMAESCLRYSLQPFWEIPLRENWREDIEVIAASLAEHNQRETNHCQKMGLKIRTGGLQASMFPTAEQIAWLIFQCCQYGVYFKATAGLHHPFRHYDADLQTHMHGFVNVFGAAVLAKAHALSADTLTEILLEEQAQKFSFAAESFSWGEYQATSSQIEEARRTLATSFGSCSFDEPREDLRQLGLL